MTFSMPASSMTIIGFHFFQHNNIRQIRKITKSGIFIPVTDSTLPASKKAFFKILTPAEAISATTAGRRDFKTPCNKSNFRYFKYSFAIAVTIIQDGRIFPSVAASAPGTPATLIPTNVAELMAIGPGVICDNVIRSVNSLTSSHLCASTIWL